jgi:HSP20 family protein
MINGKGGITMSVKKWIPWNWFKKEEEQADTAVPVKRSSTNGHDYAHSHPVSHFHREIDRLLDQAFSGFGVLPYGFNNPLQKLVNGGLFKPTLDLGATDKDYTITVEIPGVDEKDVKLEIVNDTLTIQGEKKQSSEEKGKNFYRLERSYGSFQRMLSLPEDVDQDDVRATFKNGVLTVKMSRKVPPQTDVKRIEVTSG